MIKPLKYAILILLANINMAISQSTEALTRLETKLENGDYKEIISSLKLIDTIKLNDTDKALYYKLLADCCEMNNEEPKSLKYYLRAKNLYLKSAQKAKATDLYIDIAYILSTQGNKLSKYIGYINEYIDYSKQTGDSLKIARGYATLASGYFKEGKCRETVDIFKKAIGYMKGSENSELMSAINVNIALSYSDCLNKPDSSLYYLDKDLKIIQNNGNNPHDLFVNYLNRAAAYYHIKNYNKAIKLIHKADSLPITQNYLKSKEILYNVVSIYYDSIHDYKNAYKYLLLDKKFSDSIKITEQNIAISDIQTKYKVKETNIENQHLKEKNKIYTMLSYTFFGLLIATAALGFMVVQNSRRKERISLQEKLIEQQKLEKALKDFELSSIDIMIEGQEKERQRIANDLHDNLGSMLATLKVNFENLKIRNAEANKKDFDLFEKTDDLINEAYQRVRRLAHAKNAGVFANQGLIPAVKKLAEKVSVPGKIEVEVLEYGFNGRLDNTIEFTVFRSIQELMTNILKHANATEASIQLTQHEDNLNIIIEDNGIGFNPKEASAADGMGLQSIRKKIKELGGTLDVDSTAGKGTTIIIEVPV